MTVHDASYSDPSTVSDPILEIRSASVTFDMERGRSCVLDDVTMEIQREEILGVVGESGSGKSMFASALLDAVPEPGRLDAEITYNPAGGNSIDLLSLSEEQLKKLRWERISMVFQGALSSFNPTKTIGGHIRETLLAHEYDLAEGMDHAHQLLADLYLDPDRVLDSYPHELSGGMKQRALIVLSLVLDPDVLVMDEPTAALDLLMQRSILSLIADLRDKYNLTVVFITHDLPLIAGLADRLVVMYAFEIAEVGPAEEIVTSPTHPYTRALLRSVPNLNAPLAEMQPIEGSSPDPVDTPAGCKYHPRCPLATDRCHETRPDFYPVSTDHETACFHWEQAEDAIPFSLESASPGEVDIVEGKQSAEPILSLNDLTIHFSKSNSLLNLFGDSSTVHAVDDVDLDIYENDAVVLVGESGCGKTTLGKAAIGAQRPTEGSVEFHGQDIWTARDALPLADRLRGQGRSEISFKSIRQSLQIIHQDPGGALNPNRTVRATLNEALKWRHRDLTMSDRRERIMHMLETVGMTPPDDYAKRYPHQLSGGEQQRVALIRALLMNPDVILADEAVSALDVSLRVEMMDLMHDLQEQFNTSFLFISHDLSNARYFAGSVGGRIGVMYLGEIVEIGPAEQIINDPRHPYTQLLKWSTAELGTEQEIEDPPVRGIDIPDPVDPPTGCRFHTRCPKAREACVHNAPTLEGGRDGAHDTACFREYGPDHEYWESDPLPGTDPDSRTDPGPQTSERKDEGADLAS